MIYKTKEKKRNLLLIFLVGFLLCYSNNGVFAGDSTEPAGVQQQTVKTVTGTVKDKQGEPMVGVNVAVQGTTEGTVTNINGQFSIRVNDGQTLRFSYIGYKPVTIAASKDVINVTMEEDAQSLEDVVIVGYGTQKRANLTGAVNTVDVGKTLENRPISDVGRSLQGTIPGLSIAVPNGEAGSDPVIRIRGQVASIEPTGSSAPLILLDNVEIPSITLVNPDDVQSISILKDAAASSIYGAKASLGVILITTKKGAASNQTTVSYSNNFSWSKVAKDINMATIDGLEYALLAVERVGLNRTGAFWALDRNSYNRSVDWYKKYNGKLGVNDPFVYGRDWYMDGSTKMGVRLFNSYDYMVAEWTPTMTHNLSINGKNGKTTYNVGLGYFDQSGLMKTAKKDDFKRLNATLKLSTEINKYVTIRGGFLYSQRIKDYPYITNSTTADPWLYIYRWGPLQPFGYDDNGNILRSPASEAAQANTARQQYNYANINLGGTLNFTKDWTMEADYTFTNNALTWNRPGTRYTAADSWSAPIAKLDTNGNRIYVNQDGQVVDASTSGAMAAWQLPLSTYTGVGSNPDHIRRDAETQLMHTFNIYTTYHWNLQKMHDFKFMLGTNIVYSSRQNVWHQRTQLIDIKNPQFDMATGTDTGGGQSFWEAQSGFFGRINYAFNNKYLLEANLRYDGTSKFPANLQWRWYPSFSAGWVLSEESFMKGLNPVLSFMKFRGSWGIIGDQTVANYLYVPILPYATNSLWLDSGGTKFPFFGTPLSVQPNMTWQDFKTLNFGVDSRFFKGQLGISYDWYERYTENMISAGVTLPATAGVPPPKGNFSELRTRGWELAVDFNHHFENGLGINFTASLSDANIVITDFDPTATKGTAATSYWKGKRLGDIWGYKTDGLYQKSDFETDANGKLITINVPIDPSNPNSPTKPMNKLKGDNPVYPGFPTASNFMFGPGDVKYVDLNGDGRINNGSNTANDPGDLTVIGNSNPRYQYGFRLGADYKGIDFSIFFQGIGKRSIWGDGALAIQGYNVSDGAMPEAIAGNFWREDRTDAFYARPYNIGAVAYGPTDGGGNTQVCDRYLLNMAYLRLKNVTLGYSLPSGLLKKALLTKVRIYASMENIVTWDKLKGLPIDPEVISGYSMWNTSDYNSGRTGIGAPMFKNVSVGLQLTF